MPTSPTYVDNRLPSIGLAEEGPLLVAGKPELREYRAFFVVGGLEVSQFSEEITVNCARWCDGRPSTAGVFLADAA
jgi:hypothetical protein